MPPWPSFFWISTPPSVLPVSVACTSSARIESSVIVTDSTSVGLMISGSGSSAWQPVQRKGSVTFSSAAS